MNESQEYDITIKYRTNWCNDQETYSCLIYLHDILKACDQKRILLNFKKVEFIAANLLALLGCILDEAVESKKHSITFSHIHPKVKRVMQMNGFRKYFRWDTVEDSYHSTMEYKIFQATTENLEKFEKYILINIFGRNEMSSLSGSIKDRMIDNFLEMFNNVIDHASSNEVYICGQYFHASHSLALTIVDTGKTIKENVTNFLGDQNIFDNTLKWAIIPGNSTKSQSAPGGLGFGILLEFLDLNKGSFTLISDTECYEVNSKGKRFLNMSYKFQGTIVTIIFNLNDEFAYIINEEIIDTIIF